MIVQCLEVDYNPSLYFGMGQDSVVNIVTHYGLDSPGIEVWWGLFTAPIQTGAGAYLASHTMGTASLPGVSSQCMALTTNPHLAPRLKKK